MPVDGNVGVPDAVGGMRGAPLGIDADFGTWPPLFVVDAEGNGAQPPDLMEAAAVRIDGGWPMAYWPGSR